MSGFDEFPHENFASLLSHIRRSELSPSQQSTVLMCSIDNLSQDPQMAKSVFSMPASTELLDALRKLEPHQGAIPGEMLAESLTQQLYQDFKNIPDKPRVELAVMAISVFLPTGEEALLAKTIGATLEKPLLLEAKAIMANISNGRFTLHPLEKEMKGETKVFILNLASELKNPTWVVKEITDSKIAKLIADYTNHLANDISEVVPVHHFDGNFLLQKYVSGKEFYSLNPSEQEMAQRLHKKLFEHAEYLLRYEPPSAAAPKDIKVWADPAHWNFRFNKNEAGKMKAEWFDTIGISKSNELNL